jgi:hypothetical protein
MARTDAFPYREKSTLGGVAAASGASKRGARSNPNIPATMLPGTRLMRLLYSVATSL